MHSIVLVGVTCCLAVAVGLAWWDDPPAAMRPVASVLLGLAIVLTGYTLLQALPIPSRWLGLIAPANADVWARCLSPLHEPGPRWTTVSLDPVATHVQLLRGIAYVLAFMTALRIAERREGVIFLQGAILATGLALAAAAWVHPLLGADKVFGLYRPLDSPGARHMAPIVNSNVLSGYLNIALCLVFAQALAPRPSLPRVVSLSLVAFLVATQLWVASRGGILAMVFGLALAAYLTRVAGSKETVRGKRMLVVLALVVGGSAMQQRYRSTISGRQLADTDVSKLELCAAGASGWSPRFRSSEWGAAHSRQCSQHFAPVFTRHSSRTRRNIVARGRRSGARS